MLKLACSIKYGYGQFSKKVNGRKKSRINDQGWGDGVIF